VGKLVVLIVGEGSFEQGFPVTLRLGEEGKNPSMEITGRLPPTLEIPQYYSGWATSYRHLGLPSRLEAVVAQVTNVSRLESCSKAAQNLRDRLNTWLDSESFRPIREKLLEQLMPSDEIRLIIQTENLWLRRLPWHLWDLCERYLKMEIALSATVYELIEQLVPPHPKVRILAILGNSVGINTQEDRFLLERLPNAEISFLVEPQRQELTEELWKQGWDILFFAGHSSSQGNGETGRIYINQTDSLTIAQLRYALRKAVERGLKIAILNSCDGLGLARDLADLQIPEIIVMREPVPDQVAQTFLKYFLEAYARGESFYLAVRAAREKLQGLEDQFPCATWLPVICQNLAVLPATWQELAVNVTNNSTTGSSSDYIYPDPRRFSTLYPNKEISSPEQALNSNFSRDVENLSPNLSPTKRGGGRNLARVFLLSLVITSLLMGVRHLGVLQSLELKAFDHLMQRRPAQVPDSRILVVTVTEADIQAQKQDLRPGTSLSDRSLAQLLEKLESYKPKAIGLDIYRDFPVGAGYRDLGKRLKQSDRFISVCKVSTETNDPGISPPPEVPVERLGFSDVVIDPDGVLRRHLLALTPHPASPCTASYALSSQLALRYLAAKGISLKITTDGYLQLGTTIFKPLEAHTGGYQNIDAWGHQVLLNYRSYRSASDFVPQVTLTQVLNGQLNPDAVKDKIVLIGVSAPSRNDYFLTPYSRSQTFDQQMPGVVVHAQMVSQILSAVMDHRPLLWVWPVWGEALWIWGWSLAGGLLCWRCQLRLGLGPLVVALVILYGLCFGLITQGGWVPLVPSALALVSSGGSVVAYRTFQNRRQQFTFALKS
jgi:CHASE2 domain-containing sensor protein